MGYKLSKRSDLMRRKIPLEKRKRRFDDDEVPEEIENKLEEIERELEKLP